MDTILDEVGARWNVLSKDQQMALAQTVAGVRQYTQFIALMDNWDYFQENLNLALNATGSLGEQAEIYADSWQAAENKVRASAEGIYKAYPRRRKERKHKGRIWKAHNHKENKQSVR